MKDAWLLIAAALCFTGAVSLQALNDARPAPEQGGSHFGGSVPVCVCAGGRAQ